MSSDALERRRQALAAHIVLQRMELGMQARALRSHGTVGVIARWWEIGRLAWQLVAAFRRK
jgi:hypothetical protein